MILSRCGFDPDRLEENRKALSRHPARVLQTHLYAPTERDHVAYLLDIMEPASGSVVLDAGCGYGEVARLMETMRPDLGFVLANVVGYQLEQCPEHMTTVNADCHDLPLEDDSVDIVMFNSALCNMDADRALREAHRLGTRLMINDMARWGGNDAEVQAALQATIYHETDLLEVIESCGFVVDRIERPRSNTNHFKALLPGLYERLFDQVYPIIIMAHR